MVWLQLKDIGPFGLANAILQDTAKDKEVVRRVCGKTILRKGQLLSQLGQLKTDLCGKEKL